jgi:dTDP-4-dehydrorhamnose reductase
MMKTVLILGGTGMLGNAVGKYFQAHQDKYDTYLTTRDMSLIYSKSNNWIKFDPTGKILDASHALRDVFEYMPRNPDIIINCIGVIKPFMAKNKRESILINALLPHLWAEDSLALNIKFLHITSDCVFSGAKGNYVESSLHDALDDYGKSKSLGEPVDNAMVIRTSIIGPEIHKQASLVAWAQSQAGKEVSGFTNHLWNGITCKQYAIVCSKIIDNDLYEQGLFHVHSDIVNKAELLQMIDYRYNLGLKIIHVPAQTHIDRTMATEKSLLHKLHIPMLKDQIQSL